MSEDQQTANPVVADQSSAPAPAPAEVDESLITERYSVPQDLYDNLTGMGFSSNAVKKSIIAGCIDENTCLQWLEMHLDHPELNSDIEPHIHVEIAVKRVLTDAERAAKVAELKAKIEKNRALESESLKKRQVDDEKRRMQMGKAAAQSKEAREAAQRKADYEQRRREKEEDRVAKEKIQMELAIDKLVRTGMDRTAAVAQAKREHEEKLAKLAAERAARAEEERIIAAREAEEAARRKAASQSAGGWDLSRLVLPSESELADGAASSATQPSASATSLVIDFDRDEPLSLTWDVATFSSILQRSASQLAVSDSRQQEGRKLAHRILKAIQKAPLDRKVRSLKVSSAAFTQKLAPMPLACLFLRQAGFQEASSTPELAEAGVSDLFTMHVYITNKVQCAIAALEAEGVSS